MTPSRITRERVVRACASASLFTPNRVAVQEAHESSGQHSTLTHTVLQSMFTTKIQEHFYSRSSKYL